MKVIKFGAIWCPACLIMRPRYNKVLNNYTDIENIEYDYDMDSDMVDKYKVGKILPEAINSLNTPQFFKTLQRLYICCLSFSG